MQILLAALVALLVGLAAGLLVARLDARHRGRADTVSTAAVQAIAVGVLIVDHRGRLLVSNPAARGMGLLRGDVLALPELRDLATSARAGRGAREADVRLLHGWLQHEPLAVHARAVPLGHRQTALFVEDVTSQRRVEDMRRDFVANVSHELKTPIGAISLLTEALHEARDDPEAVARFTARLLHESERLTRLAQALIDLSRLEAAEPRSAPEPVSVDRVVAEAIDRTRTAALAHRIEIVAADPSGALVRGDAQLLVTALANLLDNAVQYSPPGTRVEVSLGQRGGESHLVEICVSDAGIGIGEDDLDRIFERFYRADPARSRATGGNGLGLAIVKHIVANHGGQVQVTSRLGHGSRFTITLPTQSDTSPPASAPAIARMTS